MRTLVPATCIALLLMTAGCTDATAPSEARPNDEIAAANEQSKLQFERLVGEIEPFIRYRDDGSWSLDPAAKLSSSASAFVRQAEIAWRDARTSGEITEASLSRYGVASNQSGIRYYWWGARISVPTRAVQGVAYHWRVSGAPGAVRAFLLYYGYSAWVSSVAGALVPAYALTIWYVDRVGGYRGVHMYVPWSIVPTYIAPQ